MARVISWGGRFGVLLCVGATLFLLTVSSLGADLTVRYSQPADPPDEAMPIGNGQLEGTIFGGITNEDLQLNESGLRLGDVLFSFGSDGTVIDYERSLDLDRAVATVRYHVGDATFAREVFASYPDKVIVMRITCDQPRRICFSAKVDGPIRDAVVADGSIVARAGTSYSITNANAVTLLFSAAPTNTGGRNEEAVWQRAQEMPYANLLARHVADYQKLFHQVDLDLGRTDAARSGVLHFQYDRFQQIIHAHNSDWPGPGNSTVNSMADDRFWLVLWNQLHRIDMAAPGNPLNTNSAALPVGLPEMLLQSHFGKPQKLGNPKEEPAQIPVLDLLPALPSVWPYGHVTGLPAVGGFTVDLEWKTGRVVSATIRSTGGTVFEVHTGNLVKQYTLKKGRSIILDAGLEKWSE